jgi:D-arabinonate dehydratase
MNAPVVADARIVRIETIPLKVALDRAASGSTLKFTHRCAIVTRIHTDAGVIGESYNGGDDELQAPIVKMIGTMAGKLAGHRISAIEENWDETRVFAESFFQDRRIPLRAQACIDSALHDAVGKLAGQPLHRMWGSTATEVPVIVLGGYYREKNELEELAAEVEGIKALGIGGLKLKVGGRMPSEDLARTEAVRKAGGEDFVIACDANQGWSKDQAIEFARGAVDLDISWFEEPCKWDNDREDMAAVRKATGVKIAAGQSEITRFACRDLMAAGAIDICNFDASWGGGPTEWLRVAEFGRQYGVGVTQHIEPQIGCMLVGGASNGTYLEGFLEWRDPFFYRLIADQKPFRNGTYPLPDKPGWGFTFDTDYLEHARRKD